MPLFLKGLKMLMAYKEFTNKDYVKQARKHDRELMGFMDIDGSQRHLNMRLTKNKTLYRAAQYYQWTRYGHSDTRGLTILPTASKWEGDRLRVLVMRDECKRERIRWEVPHFDYAPTLDECILPDMTDTRTKSTKKAVMSADELRSWRDAHDMTQSELADALGLSIRQIKGYEGGTTPINRTIWLAIKGYEGL